VARRGEIYLMKMFNICVNGLQRQVVAEPSKVLLDVLGEDLRLTGAKQSAPNAPQQGTAWCRGCGRIRPAAHLCSHYECLGGWDRSPGPAPACDPGEGAGCTVSEKGWAINSEKGPSPKRASAWKWIRSTCFGHRSSEMCEYPLCLQLREALNRAFRGELLPSETSVEAWIHGFMKALHQLPLEGSYPHGFIWHLANGILLSLYCNCPCHGLVEHISCHPEAFLRSVLLMAKMHRAKTEETLGPSASLH
jgi:hypothetical protein